MKVTEAYLNRVFSKQIDMLAEGAVRIKILCVHGKNGSIGRLFAKTSPILEVIDEEISKFSYLPNEAIYKFPGDTTVQIKRVVRHNKEYCETRIKVRGLLTDQEVVAIETVGVWQMIGTDRWNKRELVIDPDSFAIPGVSYDQDKDLVEDEDVDLDNIPVAYRSATFYKAPRSDRAPWLITVDAINIEKTKLSGTKVYEEVIIPYEFEPDERSQIFLMKDGMLVIATKHIKIDTREQLMYVKVINSHIFSPSEVERVERTRTWK